MKKVLLCVISLFLSLPVLAENTLTLPKGRFRARVKPIFSPGITNKYGADAIEESLVSKFAVELDVPTAQKLNPQLAGAMQLYGVPNLGEYKPDLQLDTFVFGSAIEYGLTDNLTLGAIIPVIKASTKFTLDFQKTAQAVAHPAFANMNLVDGAEQSAMAKGYQSFGDWEKTAMGDIELGFKYQALKTPLWGFAVKAGVRLPTGYVDDPDNLTDIGFGDGQTDLGATLLVDFKPLPGLLLNFMTKYTMQLSDTQEMRIPDDGELFTANVEEVERNLGDKIDAGLYAQYSFMSLFNLNAAYNFTSKAEDAFESPLGNNAAGLALNTAQEKHGLNLGFGLTTIPLFRGGTFPLPMEVGLNIALPLLGKNVPIATAYNFEYKLYF